MTPAQFSALTITLEASAPAIGTVVGGSTVGRVLYIGAGGVLAQDGGLTYDPATDSLSVGGTFSGNLCSFDIVRASSKLRVGFAESAAVAVERGSG